MTTTEKTKEEIRQENVEARISRSEEFYNNYKKTIWTVFIAAVAIALGVLGYSKFIYGPACEEAMAAAYPAEMSFQKGNYDLALNGDGNVLGFEQIIEQYGSKAGKAVYLYAGACAVQTGKFEDAIAYLKKYNGKDAVMAARALSLEGDANVQLENYEEAVKCYDKAIAKADNDFTPTYLFKKGLACEKLGQNDKALESYKKINEKYPRSIEAYDIDRYISAVEK